MNLLFDLDGTLTDPRKGIVGCIRHALNELGHPAADDSNLQRFIGPPLLETFIELLGDSEQARHAVRLYRERFGSVGLFENKVYNGISECLDFLRATNHRLFVATSKPKIYADRIIDHFGLRPHFTHVYGSELDGTRSAKSELIAFVLAETGATMKDSLMIGDRSHDIVGARANELASIGVLWGYGSEDELNAAGADQLCESPDKLQASIRDATALLPGTST